MHLDGNMNNSGFTKVEISALEEEWSTLLERAKSGLRYISDRYSMASPSLAFSSWYELRLRDEIEGLWSDYNDLLKRTLSYMGKGQEGGST